MIGERMSNSRTILIVDDDESFAECNADLLEACGYEVHHASDGSRGLEAAIKLQPDLMILDLMMTTDTEGIEVARKIREAPGLHDMGVLLVTGWIYALKQAGVEEPYDESLPVDAVLEKPIPPQRLIEEVERVLAKKTGGQNR